MNTNEYYIDEAETLDRHEEQKLDVIKPWWILVFFFLSVIFSLISDVRSDSSLFLPARLIIIGLAIISLFLPNKWGLPLFLILAFVGPDRLQSAVEKVAFEEFNSASIWRIWLGPIRPSWIITTLIFVHSLKIKHLIFDKKVKNAILWFASVPIITALIYGSFHGGFEIMAIEIPSDIRFAVMLILSIVLFQSYFQKDPKSIKTFALLFVCIFMARHLCNFVYWLIGFGSILSGATRVTVDATKGTVVFILLFSLFMIFKRNKVILWPILGVIMCVLLLTYATRMLWVTAIMGCVILFFFYGIKKVIFMLPLTLIIVFGGIFLMQYLKPETARVIGIRAQTFVSEGDNNLLRRVDPLRYMEFINSTDTNLKRMAILWGSGYGSYYTDKIYNFPEDLRSSFPKYSATLGQFYWIHDYIFYVPFKYGLIGFIIISALWISPAWKAYGNFNKLDNSIYTGIMICLIAFLPTAIFQLWWSGKGLLINGLVIALIKYLPFYDQVYVDERELL